MKFSEKIIKLRKEHGLSQEEFGNEINVSRQAISKWESEQSQPDLNNVREISKKFNVSIEYLINEDLDNDIKEDSLEKRKKQNKNKKKIILRIFLIIIVIYLLIIIVKFVRITQIYYKAKNIDENKNFDASIEWNHQDKVRGENFLVNDDYIHYNGTFLQVHYDGDYSTIPTSMTYINKNKNIAYRFHNIGDEERGKFEYYDIPIDEENIEEYNIKQLTLRYIPTTIIGRLEYAINPKKIIYLFEDIIEFKYTDGYTRFLFDQDTGEIKEIISITDIGSNDISYSYEWNDALISEKDVENPLLDSEYEYIKTKNIEE